jgi:hypothetical protein
MKPSLATIRVQYKIHHDVSAKYLIIPMSATTHL